MSTGLSVRPGAASRTGSRPPRRPRVDLLPYALVSPLALFIIGLALVPAAFTVIAAFLRIAPLDPPARADLSLVWRADRLSRLGEHLVLLAAEHLGCRDVACDVPVGVDGGRSEVLAGDAATYSRIDDLISRG